MDGIVNCLYNEVDLQNQKRSILQTKFGMGLFFINELLWGVVFIDVSHFAVGATPSRDFSDILSRCELQ